MPPSGSPGTATITQVRYSWTWAKSGTPPGLEVFLCNSARCASLPPSLASGTTSAFNGDPANSTWKFYFRSNTSSTYVFQPPWYGGKDQVIVNYT